MGPALSLACLALAFFAEVVLADTTAVTVAPTSGLATASFTVDGTYTWSNGCPALAPIPLTFDFLFDGNPKAPIWSVTTSACAKNMDDTGPSKPYTPPASLATPGGHKIVLNVLDSAGKIVLTNTTGYMIMSPPSPSPSPSPSRTPSTAPPPTTPPPTHRPSPAPTPVQQPPASPTATATPPCVAGAAAPGCPSPSATPCIRSAASTPPAGPGGPGRGLMLAFVLFGALPVTGVFLSSRHWIRRRAPTRLACVLAVTGLLVANMSCGRSLASLSSAASPTPTVSAQPTPSC